MTDVEKAKALLMGQTIIDSKNVLGTGFITSIDIPVTTMYSSNRIHHTQPETIITIRLSESFITNVSNANLYDEIVIVKL